jgi:hypothetical protein
MNSHNIIKLFLLGKMLGMRLWVNDGMQQSKVLLLMAMIDHPCTTILIVSRNRFVCSSCLIVPHRKISKMRE